MQYLADSVGIDTGIAKELASFGGVGALRRKIFSLSVCNERKTLYFGVYVGSGDYQQFPLHSFADVCLYLSQGGMVRFTRFVGGHVDSSLLPP